ncbi:MAG: hypothetical protein Q9187_003736 [Circinaria calcarea]
MRLDWHTVQSSTEHSAFAFVPDIPPTSSFVFPKAQSPTSQRDSPKRIRPRADVDGEGSEDAQNKKRRLRLDFITSRLSRPYALPTTHIASRGQPRIAMWARQKAPGKNVLYKAAIINSIKKKSSPKKKTESKGSTGATNVYGEDGGAHRTICEGSDAVKRPREMSDVQSAQQSHGQTHSTPVGLSNYDALDQEDRYDDLYQDDESDCESVYSDFSYRDIADDQSDDYDFLTSPSHTTSRYLPRSPSMEEVNELVKDDDK